MNDPETESGSIYNAAKEKAKAIAWPRSWQYQRESLNDEGQPKGTDAGRLCLVSKMEKIRDRGRYSGCMIAKGEKVLIDTG
jgi:hypothetical protein